MNTRNCSGKFDGFRVTGSARSAIVPCLASVLLWIGLASASRAADDEGWRPLFNGRNLDGWTVKIAGHPIGENFRNTYRVEDGIIKANYDDYDIFDEQFGHLYSNSPYSHYVLRLEYLLTGETMADAPEWAGRNSGVMIHSQSPLSMTLEQLWPVSLEGQFLAEGTTVRPQTGNACTPGTHVTIEGEQTTAHIIEADAELYPQDEWVQFEIEVHGHELVIHRVNGVEVLRYTHPVLDETDPDAQRLLAAGASKRLGMGHIALQAEGHPVWFRNIMIRALDE